MTPDSFLKNFGAFAHAPGCVMSLRRLALHLAATGQLSGGGSESWERRELVEVADSISDGPFGSKLKKSHYVHIPGYRVLRLGNVGAGYFKDADRSYVSKNHFESLSHYHLEKGDVLVASLGNPPGRACEVPEAVLPAVNKADCFRVRFGPDVEPKFAVVLLNAPRSIARALDLHRGDTRGRITLSHLRKTPVRFPPLEEQKRIVAKVDEFLALCDELEARQQKKAQISVQLNKAALHAVVEAPDPKTLRKSWKRIHDNFDLLYDRIENVDELRQVVLQLAVKGALVGPTKVDGSVNEAIRLGQSEIEDGAHRSKGRDASSVTIPGIGALSVGRCGAPEPEGHRWVSLLSIARLESGHTPSRNRPEYWDGEIPWIGIRDARLNHGKVIHQTLQTVSELGLRNSSARLLPKGTVCLSRTASVGYAIVMGQSMATSQDFVNWVCSSAILPEYLQLVLLAEKPNLRRFSKGAVHNTIYFPEVKAFHVLVPSPARQRRTLDAVTKYAALCDELESKLKQADEDGERLMRAVVESLVA